MICIVLLTIVRLNAPQESNQHNSGEMSSLLVYTVNVTGLHIPYHYQKKRAGFISVKAHSRLASKAKTQNTY